MNMTRFTARLTLVVGATFGSLLFMAAQPTQAATWHKGTPSNVRGTWKTKKLKVNTGSTSVTAYDQVTIGKTSLADYSYTGSSRVGIKGTSAKYATVGKYTYVIKVKIAKGVYGTLHVKKQSSKVLVIGNGTKNVNPAKYYKA